MGHFPLYVVCAAVLTFTTLPCTSAIRLSVSKAAESIAGNKLESPLGTQQHETNEDTGVAQVKDPYLFSLDPTTLPDPISETLWPGTPTMSYIGVGSSTKSGGTWGKRRSKKGVKAVEASKNKTRSENKASNDLEVTEESEVDAAIDSGPSLSAEAEKTIAELAGNLTDKVQETQKKAMEGVTEFKKKFESLLKQSPNSLGKQLADNLASKVQVPSGTLQKASWGSKFGLDSNASSFKDLLKQPGDASTLRKGGDDASA